MGEIPWEKIKSKSHQICQVGGLYLRFAYKEWIKEAIILRLKHHSIIIWRFSTWWKSWYRIRAWEQSGTSWTKWEFVRRTNWNKLEQTRIGGGDGIKSHPEVWTSTKRSKRYEHLAKRARSFPVGRSTSKAGFLACDVRRYISAPGRQELCRVLQGGMPREYDAYGAHGRGWPGVRQRYGQFQGGQEKVQGQGRWALCQPQEEAPPPWLGLGRRVIPRLSKRFQDPKNLKNPS